MLHHPVTPDSSCEGFDNSSIEFKRSPLMDIWVVSVCIDIQTCMPVYATITWTVGHHMTNPCCVWRNPLLVEKSMRDSPCQLVQDFHQHCWWKIPCTSSHGQLYPTSYRGFSIKSSKLLLSIQLRWSYEVVNLIIPRLGEVWNLEFTYGLYRVERTQAIHFRPFLGVN